MPFKKWLFLLCPTLEGSFKISMVPHDHSPPHLFLHLQNHHHRPHFPFVILIPLLTPLSV